MQHAVSFAVSKLKKTKKKQNDKKVEEGMNNSYSTFFACEKYTSYLIVSI